MPLNPVTRIEIAEHVEGAFGGAPVSRAELVACAKHTAGRRELQDLLQTLPDRSYNQLRDLWTYLRDVPIDSIEVPAVRPTS